MHTLRYEIQSIAHALYINLEARTDRRAHVEAQLAALKHADNGLSNLTAERFSAIRHAEHGAIGCSLSHMRCIQIAK
jgi:GR25 family glycosyltransferase involved in LPS biosynthesis